MIETDSTIGGNVFNQSPPYIYSAALANSDPSTYDYVGRFVYGRVTHKF